MQNFKLNTPVVLIIFKRPDTTEKVFEAIRQAQPPKLLAIADGPRADVSGEAEKCAAARAIIDRVDWDCEVLTNYSDTNLGLRTRVYTGLDWAFEIVEEAIILEDDCIPHPTFFRFCEELLEKYRDDEEIMTISGDNFQFKQKQRAPSYYFSLYPHCWGWATWRRAWQLYDNRMEQWPQAKNQGWLNNISQDSAQFKYWKDIFQRTYEGLNSWNYAWQFACWMQNGLTILPEVNLISNIGFREDAVHTKSNDLLSELYLQGMNFPLHHPIYKYRDVIADNFTEKLMFSGRWSNLEKDSSLDLSIHQAMAHLNAQKYDRALSLFEKAISLNPDNPELNYGKAVTLARLGRMNEAAEALKRLLAVRKTHPKARKLMNEIQPTSISDLLAQATAALQANQNHEALSLLTQARTLDRIVPKLNYLRAISFLRLDLPEQALQAAGEELKAYPNNWEAKSLISQIFNKSPEVVISYLLAKTEQHPVLLDIGASGSTPKIWESIAKQSVYVGFDPDARDIHEIQDDRFHKGIIVNKALTAEEATDTTSFYLTKFPHCSSTLFPDFKSIENYIFSNLFEVEKQVSVPAVSLNSVVKLLEIDRIDWFKTDSQGTDLRLFKSLNDNVRANVLAVDVEPGLVDVYLGEDLFVDAHTYLTRNGFWLSDLNVCGEVRMRRSTLNQLAHSQPGITDHQIRNTFKRSPAWCEARYLRSLESMSQGDFTNKDYTLLWVFAVIDRQLGFALDLGLEYEKRFGEDEISQIMLSIAGFNSSSVSASNSVSASDLVKQAFQCLKDNQNTEAFNLLNQAKSFKQPTVGLDYLRAVCFLRQNLAGAAIQTLYEELRYFPDNAEAKRLLSELEVQNQQIYAGRIHDSEFQELLRTIRPYTMVSETALYSLFSLAKQVCINNIPGNIVECGVAGGGSTALMAAIVKRYTKQPRILYAFDSFEGMPESTERDKHNGIQAEITGWGAGTCAAPKESVREICEKLGVLDIVKPIEGYFQDTLPRYRETVSQIALLHMDADWYKSTQDILNNLYDNVISGGFIQTDDYGYWEGCRQAIHEFETLRQTQFSLNQIDAIARWFRKPS